MFGGLAQLVERLLCKQDVSGSSPLTSTDQPFQTTGGYLCEIDFRFYPLPADSSFVSFPLIKRSMLHQVTMYWFAWMLRVETTLGS